MKQVQQRQRTIFTIFVIAGLGLISSPSGMNTFGGFKAMMTIKSAFAAGPYGIVDQPTPELRLTNWINGNGFHIKVDQAVAMIEGLMINKSEVSAWFLFPTRSQ